LNISRQNDRKVPFADIQDAAAAFLNGGLVSGSVSRTRNGDKLGALLSDRLFARRRKRTHETACRQKYRYAHFGREHLGLLPFRPLPTL
jgi:hypothetical protein